MATPRVFPVHYITRWGIFASADHRARHGRNPNEATVETINFEGSGRYAAEAVAAPAPMMSAVHAKCADTPEPSFEPGETMLQMQLVGKVRFR